MGTIEDHRALALHDPTVEVNGEKVSVIGSISTDYATFIGEGHSEILDRVGEFIGRAPLSALHLPPWLTLARLKEFDALQHDTTMIAVLRSLCARLGALRSAANIFIWAHKKAWRAEFGPFALFIDVADYDYGEEDLEMRVGSDRQRLQTSLRFRDGASTPVPHGDWHLTRVDEICTALSLPLVKHDWTQVPKIPAERQAALLAAGAFQFVIRPKTISNVVSSVSLFAVTLYYTRELLETFSVGEKTTLRIDDTVDPPELLFWDPKRGEEGERVSATVEKVMKRRAQVLKDKKMEKVGELASFTREEFVEWKKREAAAKTSSAPAAASSSKLSKSTDRSESSSSSAPRHDGSKTPGTICKVADTKTSPSAGPASPQFIPTSAEHTVDSEWTSDSGATASNGEAIDQEADEALSAARAVERRASRQRRRGPAARMLSQLRTRTSSCHTAPWR